MGCTIESLSYQTSRCIVRFLSPADYAEFINGYARCEESKNRFDEGRIDVSKLTEQWFSDLLIRRRKEAAADDCYMFHAFDSQTHEAIGYCNIRTIYRGDIQCGEIGYTVFNHCWSKGFGTEIVKALTQIGFGQLGFHRLEAYVNLDNMASKKVLLKSGYCFECVREKYLLEDGTWTDNEVYYIISDTPKMGDDSNDR